MRVMDALRMHEYHIESLDKANLSIDFSTVSRLLYTALMLFWNRDVKGKFRGRTTCPSPSSRPSSCPPSWSLPPSKSRLLRSSDPLSGHPISFLISNTSSLTLLVHSILST